jgi:hypothetical protein
MEFLTTFSLYLRLRDKKLLKFGVLPPLAGQNPCF